MVINKSQEARVLAMRKELAEQLIEELEGIQRTAYEVSYALRTQSSSPIVSRDAERYATALQMKRETSETLIFALASSAALLPQTK